MLQNLAYSASQAELTQTHSSGSSNLCQMPPLLRAATYSDTTYLGEALRSLDTPSHIV
jgi:hypothetical protein